ncbi:MAG TPA: hypothetical protein VFS50_01685 [Meiothermus sp.]|jgi:hypothetical protein|nr:hypothetical protein [Meiothermus sp.]
MRLQGRIGGTSAGYDLRLEWSEQPEGSTLSGRIGGQVEGKDVHLELPPEAPPEVVALAAVIAFKALDTGVSLRESSEDAQNSAVARSSGGSG